MKKIINLITFLGLAVVLITGCNKDYDNSISYKEFVNADVSTNNITHKFIGKSEHFGFETGDANISDTEKQILIANFKQRKKTDKFDKISFYVKFKGEFWGKTYWTKGSGESFNKYIKNTLLYENISPLNNNDVDSFSHTTKETFKDDISITVEYCLNKQCKSENLKLEFIE